MIKAIWERNQYVPPQQKNNFSSKYEYILDLDRW